jgi:hypothetical protein
MVLPSSSFFSIDENAFRGIYPTPQLEMLKIFNRIFEAGLTKGGLRTSSCPCVASFRRSHSNATFACAQAIAFYSFCYKIDWILCIENTFGTWIYWKMQNLCDIHSFIGSYFIHQHINPCLKCVFSAWYSCKKCTNLWMNELLTIFIINS